MVVGPIFKSYLIGDKTAFFVSFISSAIKSFVTSKICGYRLPKYILSKTQTNNEGGGGVQRPPHLPWAKGLNQNNILKEIRINIENITV